MCPWIVGNAYTCVVYIQKTILNLVEKTIIGIEFGINIQILISFPTNCEECVYTVHCIYIVCMYIYIYIYTHSANISSYTVCYRQVPWRIFFFFLMYWKLFPSTPSSSSFTSPSSFHEWSFQAQNPYNILKHVQIFWHQNNSGLELASGFKLLFSICACLCFRLLNIERWIRHHLLFCFWFLTTELPGEKKTSIIELNWRLIGSKSIGKW